jgi:flavin-dependent dehydrogenase
LIVITNKGRYRTKILVGADGVFSAVQQAMSLPRKRHLAPSIEIFSPADPKNDPELDEKRITVDFTPVSEGLQGYVWHIPCLRDGLPSMAHGIADFRIHPERPRAEMAKIFSDVLRSRNIQKGPESWASHPIPWFSEEDPVSQPNVILVGDASGIEPAFGGGIHIALSYGEIGALAIIDAFQNMDFSFQDYKERLMSHFMGRYLCDCTRLALEMYGDNSSPLNLARDFFSGILYSSTLLSLLLSKQ